MSEHPHACPDCGWDAGMKRYCDQHNPCFGTASRRSTAPVTMTSPRETARQIAEQAKEVTWLAMMALAAGQADQAEKVIAESLATLTAALAQARVALDANAQAAIKLGEDLCMANVQLAAAEQARDEALKEVENEQTPR